jgi:photosystem II biogenesis protein Psp29
MSTNQPGKATMPAQTEFSARYASARGARVETVSSAMTRFMEAFGRPLPIVYRGLINELLVSTHLAVVCPMFRYCPLVGYGVDEVFASFLRYYPSADERDHLYTCVCKALNFDKATLKADAAAIREWTVGKTEEDVFAASKAGDGPVGSALKACANGDADFQWYYSRMFGLGVVRVMEAVGASMTVDAAEAWCAEMSLPKGKVGAEMGGYLSTTERLKQAEMLFAEVAARDARKSAERLAEKAKKAKAAADKIEAGEPDDGEKDDVEKPAAELAAEVASDV